MERPDYRRIHELEYELGFREDPPPSRLPSTRAVDGIIKELYTDAPGAVVFYDPRHGRPEYDSSNPFSHAALLRRYYEPQVIMPPARLNDG